MVAAGNLHSRGQARVTLGCRGQLGGLRCGWCSVVLRSWRTEGCELRGGKTSGPARALQYGWGRQKGCAARVVDEKPGGGGAAKGLRCMWGGRRLGCRSVARRRGGDDETTRRREEETTREGDDEGRRQGGEETRRRGDEEGGRRRGEETRRAGYEEGRGIEADRAVLQWGQPRAGVAAKGGLRCSGDCDAGGVARGRRSRGAVRLEWQHGGCTAGGDG